VTAEPILVVQNDPTDGVARLGDWLTAAGAELVIVRPYEGGALPGELAGYGGLVVLGGAQSAYAQPAEPWFGELSGLLRTAVADGLPTLAICLGGQLLAQAVGGRVQRSDHGPVIGPRLVARRDAADKDPLFGPVPFTPDVFQWHSDEITVLPPGALLLASSPSIANQAFRVGSRAWGLQFHIECDIAMIERWAADDAAVLDELGYDAETVVARCAAVMDDVEDAWKPFAERFVALVRGTIGSMYLPVIEA
jgi:GMP synthase-like glutamine amidotransferase